MRLRQCRGSNRNYWSLPGRERLRSPVHPKVCPAASDSAPVNEIRNRPEIGDPRAATGKKFSAKKPEPQSSYARCEERDGARNFREIATCVVRLAISPTYSNMYGGWEF